MAAAEYDSPIPGGPLTPTTEENKEVDSLSVTTDNAHRRSQSVGSEAPSRDQFAPKRRSLRGPASVAKRAKPSPTDSQICKALHLLTSGKCSKYGGPFWDPVDPISDDAPDYYEVIQRPMDLDTIVKKHNAMKYNNPAELRADIDLMLANCFTYNAKDTEVYDMGKKWECEMQKIWQRVFG